MPLDPLACCVLAHVYRGFAPPLNSVKPLVTPKYSRILSVVYFIDISAILNIVLIDCSDYNADYSSGGE